MILEASGIGITARLGGAPVEAIRDLSFGLAKGRVLALVGESGAGKSMVGRLIARALPSGFAVSAGTLRFDGADLLTLPEVAHRALLGSRIAFIPQEPLTALNPLMTVEAQFGEHLARLGVPGEAREARMLAALGEVGLPEPAGLLARYPFQLSGGMNQRVLIAMAFAGEPALVIADEPTTALDVSTQARIVQVIRRMQREHRTAMLFITHDLRLAAHLGDDILVLYAGEAIEQGPARTLLAAPGHPYTRALKAANPSLSGPRSRLVALPEQMPGLAAFAALSGCRFAPRCPTRHAACESAVPALTEIAPGHAVRCAPACRVTIAAREAPPLPAPAIAPGEPILSVENVAKHYPGKRDWLGRRGPGVDAVKRADLAVRPGEFLGIVGESGSGKSTLARLIMGLERPSAGRILLDGRDVTVADRPAQSLRLGALQMVFQDPQSALNPRRRVGRLVTQVMEGAGRTAAGERRRRALELLAETGLPPELIDRYPSQLSGGQRQRVNIARALCITPRLIVADEIVSGLDVSVQAQILNLLLDLRQRRGIGLVFISHDLAVVRYLCQRLIVMKDGEIVETGETEAVFAAPHHAYTQALLAASPPDDTSLPWPAEAALPDQASA